MQRHHSDRGVIVVHLIVVAPPRSAEAIAFQQKHLCLTEEEAVAAAVLPVAVVELQASMRIVREWMT